VLSKPTEPYMIYAGNPAVTVKKRVIAEKNPSRLVPRLPPLLGKGYKE